MNEDARAIAVRVSGRVQGVSYRAYTREQAMRLGVTGWVSNCHDASVEAVLVGAGGALAELIRLMREGPPHAAVTSLDVRSVDRARAGEGPRDGYTF